MTQHCNIAMKGVVGEKSQTCGKITFSGVAQFIQGNDNTFSPAWTETGPRSGWARPAQSRPTAIGARCMPGSVSQDVRVRVRSRKISASVSETKSIDDVMPNLVERYIKWLKLLSNAHDSVSRKVIYIIVNYRTPKVTNAILSKPAFPQ